MQTIKFSYRAKATTGAVGFCVVEEYAFECPAVEAGAWWGLRGGGHFNVRKTYVQYRLSTFEVTDIMLSIAYAGLRLGIAMFKLGWGSQ